MARRQATLWQRNKYWLSALVLVLPVWFFYESMNPEFPDMLETKTVGAFDIAPMPYDLEPPYRHDGVYVKDFLLLFSQGDLDTIRQAYLNIGTSALPLEQMQARSEGVLHGTRHGQHVHALANATLNPDDKIWLTVQYWDGGEQIASWPLPETLL